MNEDQVGGVSRVELDAASRLSQARMEMSETSHANSSSAESEQQVGQASSKQAEPVKKEPEPVVHNSLKFLVDDDTHEVTVLIVDKATQKVVQTIPPEAMKDIPIGQLLQYSI